jgi:membrane-associated phospholipid phosphatase
VSGRVGTLLASLHVMRTRLLLITSAASVAAFALLARSVARRDTVDGDNHLRDTLVANQGRLDRAIAVAAGPLGKEWFHGPVALGITGWLWQRHAGRRSMLPVLASGSAEVVNRVCERTLHIRRPPPGQENRHKPSFPSGHAMETTAVALTSGYVLAREGLVTAPAAAVVAVSLAGVSGAGRLYIDRHWVSDAAGGYLLGIGIAGFCAAAYEHMRASGDVGVKRRRAFRQRRFAARRA